MIRFFKIEQPQFPSGRWLDGLILAVLCALLYLGVRLSLGAPEAIRGPEISLAPASLPWYAALSIGRMSAAYALSMLFSLVYGSVAAGSKQAERYLLPVLDVLQSVPILSFLPVVLLSLSAFLPQAMAAEIASIVLIFTSQAWNLTFAWYQSLATTPNELTEASTIFRFNAWFRFKTLQLPFAAISLIWNSMMSWAGGWFFLMAAEIFTVGQKDFRLPGLGSYLQEAANQQDFRAILWGLGTVILVIVALDQLVWRPILAWADRFKLSTLETDEPPTSWLYDALQSSRLAAILQARVLRPLSEGLDAFLVRHFQATPGVERSRPGLARLGLVAKILLAVSLVLCAYLAVRMLSAVPASNWLDMLFGVLATLLRVVVALVIALAWTIPVGVAIGTNPRLAALLQPVVQVAASIPATAIFPVVLLFLVNISGGLNLAAVLLMLMGTQWYLLFNIIAGAATIPQDLQYTTTLLQIRGWARWRTLILPALFPYIITGSITAGGGAWNASIVSEYVNFGGHTLQTMGIGAIIAQATADGNYPMLLASTLSMVVTVVTINRLVWRRLFRLAEEQYRLE